MRDTRFQNDMRPLLTVMRLPMTKKEDRMKACLEASARLRRRLEAMERVPRSYKPGVDGCQDRVASAIGLLTEVALLGFERLGRYIEEIGRSGDVVTDVRALSLAFVTFALDHPVHFRLTFRNDLMNRKDPRYPEMSGKPGCGSVLQLLSANPMWT